MTRNDIIRMASEAGGWGNDAVSFCEFAELEVFAKLVATYEREQCARLALDMQATQGSIGRILACQDIAAAIRARS